MRNRPSKTGILVLPRQILDIPVQNDHYSDFAWTKLEFLSGLESFQICLESSLVCDTYMFSRLRKTRMVSIDQKSSTSISLQCVKEPNSKTMQKLCNSYRNCWHHDKNEVWILFLRCLRFGSEFPKSRGYQRQCDVWRMRRLFYYNWLWSLIKKLGQVCLECLDIKYWHLKSLNQFAWFNCCDYQVSVTV